jgi:hypothetical protein
MTAKEIQKRNAKAESLRVLQAEAGILQRIQKRILILGANTCWRY